MAVLNLNDPVNGTTADATLIATNNAAVKSVVNGNLDNSNIVAGAGIVFSKFSGYPADSTKFARGDGTWAVPVAAVGYSPPSPATSLPVSPADKDQAILVDSTSSPTYSWLLQYLSSASAWVFIGGSPQSAEVTTQEARNSTSYGDCSTVHSLTLVRAGTYDFTFGCLGQTASATNNSYYMSPKYSASEATDADGLLVTTAAVTQAAAPLGSRTRRIVVAANAQVVTMRYKQQAADTATKVSNRFLKVTPVTLT